MNQIESRIQQAYKLSQNLDRTEDYPPEWVEEWGIVDAKVIGKLAERENLDLVFTNPESINSFDEINMEGSLCDFEGIDYIYTKPDLPVMSGRMLSVLRSVQNFPHQIIPIAIEDTEVAEDSLTERSGKINTDYVAVQLLEQLDIFDREKSVYRPSSISSHGVGRIRRLVLKVTPQGLPPIFRIIENSTYLYVSPEAKTALEEAGITGIRFVDINF